MHYSGSIPTSDNVCASTTLHEVHHWCGSEVVLGLCCSPCASPAAPASPETDSHVNGLSLFRGHTNWQRSSHVSRLHKAGVLRTLVFSVRMVAANGTVLAESWFCWALAFNCITGSTASVLLCLCGKRLWCLPLPLSPASFTSENWLPGWVQ